jgi:hypothetical protein
MRRLLLALVLLSGCASPTCLVVGCSSGIWITGASAGASVCLDGVCNKLLGEPSSRSLVSFDDVHEGDAKHVLTVDGIRYEGTITFEKVQPNGAKCPPRCYHAAFVLANGKLDAQGM